MTVISSYASAIWPVANLALYFPFVLFTPTLVRTIWWVNGAAVSGNVDAGVYDVDGTKLISTGSTAQATINVYQEVNVTDTLIGPGDFYLALACDNITAAFFRGTTTSSVTSAAMGTAQQASAFSLPATATFARNAQTYIPLFGFYARVV